MKLAILFWFYKEPDICKNRLELLRQHNPTIPIYGVYGGDPSAADQYKLQLDRYLDDFYAFTEDKDSLWKWLQGDLMLAHWYRERGNHLSWDTVVVIQWDMLVFGAIDQLFAMLKPDQILLSGLRPIAEVENDWMWVTPKIPANRNQYMKFLEYVGKKYSYRQDPMGCIFIVACMPRIFLEAYSKIEQPELGFLEYRIPIYAQIFDIPFCENHPFEAWWVDGDPKFHARNSIQRAINLLHLRLNPNSLNPTRSDISLIPICRHLSHKKGSRIFHPYQYLFPLKKQHWPGALLREFRRDFDWLAQKLVARN